MSEFDKKAADWDKNKIHSERSETIAQKLTPYLKNRELNSALEFGAGTGLLSFLLNDRFKEMVLMDSSQEMVNMANSKINESGNSHMKAVFFDLEKNNYEERKFDAVFTQMVLHHVSDVPLILKKFKNLLNANGILAIADLFSEDGSFHGEGFTGHLGFDPEDLKEKLIGMGFKSVEYQTAYIYPRQLSNGSTVNFPIFLLIAS